MSQTTTAASGSEARLVRILDSYLAALQEGAVLDKSALLAEHPDLAEDLEACLASLEFIRHAAVRPLIPEAGGEQARHGPISDPDLGILGDFRILREVGRGGMGVVYEAEQISLGRRVALKVLPFAAALDQRQLQRFKVEAQAAAQLHHTHIVPVFTVGVERGVHFYAMQFIEGRTLAGVIGELHQFDGAREAQAQPATGDPASPLALGSSTRTRSFFRTVAELGIQAAEALEYAHSLGVIHRDIKPANLLIDARGSLWVTDFGLAQLHAEPGLTITGDLVGTLRYMSPEQALGRRGIIDHRTDLYGLGVTIYELLTLRPAFSGIDRQTILRKIDEEEPPSPRWLNPAIPRELETIVLKATAKEPGSRYATARELAEDLRRWLRGEPIAARPIAAWRRAWKRFRRRPAPVLAALAAGLSLLLLALAPWFWRRHLADQEAIRARDVVIRAEHLRKQAERYVQGIQSAARLIHLGDAEQAHALLQTLGDSDDDHPRGFEWYRLERLVRGEPLILADHQGDVYAAVYSPDGATLATCGKDGTIRLRDPASGQTRQVLGPVGTELNGLSFSPDGSRLAACGDDSRIRVWELASLGRTVLTIDAHEKQEAVGVLYTPDGRWLLSYGRDGFIRRWDAATGKLMASWSGYVGQIESAAIAMQGTTLVIGGWNSQVWVHDWLKGLRIRGLDQGWYPDHPLFFIYCVALSAEGRLAASQVAGKDVNLWDLTTGRVVRALQGHHDLVYSLAFAADGRSLASLGVDGELRLWNLEDGTSTGRLTGHIDRSWCVTFSPDGRRLVTTGREGTVRLWDIDGWDGRYVLSALPKMPRTLAFSRDGNRLTVFDVSGASSTWDVATRAPLGSEGGPAHVAMSGDGRRLASTKDESSSIDVFGDDGREPLASLGRLGPVVNSMALARDGRTLAVQEPLVPSTRINEAAVEGVQVTRALDVETARETARHESGPNEWETTHLIFSPHGDRVVGRANGGWLWAWNLDGGESSRIPFKEGREFGLVFSFDGSLLATSGPERTITLLDPDTLEVRARLGNHTGAVYGLDFSPDGRTLASASADGTVRLWNVATGHELLKLGGHSGPVRCVRFSDDGRTLASAAETPSGMSEVILWHTARLTKDADPRPERAR